MSKSDSWEAGILALIFQAINYANIADNAVSAPLTNLFFALHTADPGEAGTQTTNEVVYGGYARVTVARSTGGFVLTGSSISPVAIVSFPACTSGSATATFASIGGLVTTGGRIFYSGAITPSLVISTGVTPRLTTTSTITED